MELNDKQELRNLLQEWQVPPLSPSVEERILTARKPWWYYILTGYVRVPVPVICCITILLLVAELWRWTRPISAVVPPVLVKTERIEVPVIQERIVTKIVYKNKPNLAGTQERGLTFRQLRPVGELRPRIIRGGHDQN